MNMENIQNWKINTQDLELDHISGLKLKKIAGGYDKDAEWLVISGNAIQSLIDEGVSLYKHITRENKKVTLNEN